MLAGAVTVLSSVTPMSWWKRRQPDSTPLTSVSWDEVLGRRWAMWSRMDATTRGRVEPLGRRLIQDLRFEAARGVQLTDDMPVLIAAQAALLVSGWELDPHQRVEPFSRISSVIVHRSTVVVQGERQLDGDVGRVVSDTPAHLSGQAHHRGPVVLSWSSVVSDARHPSRRQSVVMHEFAHQLDMLDGVVDGTPPFDDHRDRARFVEVCTAAFNTVRGGDDTVLRDYAATNPGEFFAVATETFFTDPLALRDHHGELYDVLVDFYRQDPARWATS